MNLTNYSLKNPAGVAVGVAIVFLFGLFSLFKLPLQLFPDIEEPRMTINAGWRSASPQEMESEILEPLEDVLQGLPGMQEMNANVGRGWLWVNLTFGLGTDMNHALVDVLARLNRMRPLPVDATRPFVQLGDGGGGANASLTWFFIQKLPDTRGEIGDYQQFVDDVIKPRIESVPGVAGVNLNGVQDEELQVVFDPYRAAEYGIPISEIAALVGRSNDISGGFVDVGRRQFTLRFEGRYSPNQLSELILDWRDGRPVRLGDIAEVRVQRADADNIVIQNGNSAMAIQVLRENGANVLETLEEVKEVVAELREGPVAAQGLAIEQSFDASVFIYRAVNLVTGNLLLGVFFAVGVLWWFLRRMRATLLVAFAIPASLLGTFIVLNITGRTLNVISLAGLAFATGMVLDAAIVVLENIVRLREEGKSPEDSSRQGADQVWGALVASTATTVAIFLPVIFLKDASGQLFADLALTIAIAVSISLIVAVTVLPVIATRWLTSESTKDYHASAWTMLAQKIMWLTGTTKRRFALIIGMMGIPILVTVLLIPSLDYLPPVKRDAVDAFFQVPPGANTDTVKREVVDVMVERLRPYMEGTKEPALRNYYFWMWPGGGTLGIRAKDQGDVDELKRVVREEIMIDLPDTQGFADQGNLFGGFGSNRSIEIHLQSTDLRAIIDVARVGKELITTALPGSQVQAWPGLELAEPELRLRPNDQRILEAGWTRVSMGTVVQALGDGAFLGEYFDGEKRMNVILRGEPWENTQELSAVPLATPSGEILQFGELVDIEATVGPTAMRRIDGSRTITLQVNPPDNVSLEEAMSAIRDNVEPQLRALLPADGSIQYGGSASSLNTAVKNMTENFALALLVLFLLMSALFRSPRDSMFVLLTIPLATVGGVIAIRILNLVTFQPLDLLTMIGFIILLGLVVNNAILLVHQTRMSEREGSNRTEAVAMALRIRLRPIFMSTTTTIFGMLPLVLIPGAGSVMYRGLAMVIVGGMSISAIFTLVLLPCFLRLGERAGSTATTKATSTSTLEHAT